MKCLNYLLIILLVYSFTLVSCKKSITEPDEATIVGKWQLVNVIGGILFTTNSNQTALNTDKSTGQILVTGNITTTLNDLSMDLYEYYSVIIIRNSGDGEQNYGLFIDESTEEGTFRQYDKSKTFVGNINYTFDRINLIVTESILKDIDSDESVIISGSLSFDTFDIPANTPTLLVDPDIGMYDESTSNMVIEFREDGTGTMSTTDEDTIEVEHFSYLADDNIIAMTNQDNDTVASDYSISGEYLILTYSDVFDICFDESQSECFADYEEWYNLKSGSLTDINFIFELIFTKSLSKTRKETANDFIIQRKVFNKFIERIQKQFN